MIVNFFVYRSTMKFWSGFSSFFVCFFKFPHQIEMVEWKQHKRAHTHTRNNTDLKNLQSIASTMSWGEQMNDRCVFTFFKRTKRDANNRPASRPPKTQFVWNTCYRLWYMYVQHTCARAALRVVLLSFFFFLFFVFIERSTVCFLVLSITLKYSDVGRFRHCPLQSNHVLLLLLLVFTLIPFFTLKKKICERFRRNFSSRFRSMYSCIFNWCVVV